MLNDNDRITTIRQSAQDLHQLVDIRKMQTGCRLIQNINGLSGSTAAQLRSQLDSLCLSAGELGRRLSQADVGKSHIVQGCNLPVNGGNILKELHGLFHSHVQHVVNALSLVFDIQRFAVVTLAAADLTRHIDIR